MAKGHYLAYAFKSKLTPDEMQERLNKVTPWKWNMGDSEYYGEYLMARLYRGYSKFRIFTEKDTYVFDIYYSFDDHGAEDLWESQHSLVLNEIFPSIEARDIRPTENYG